MSTNTRISALVVEDYGALNSLYRTVFEGMNLGVVASRNAQDAVMLAGELEPRIILTDYKTSERTQHRSISNKRRPHHLRLSSRISAVRAGDPRGT
jgi:CheY-like chemotaxis protein